MLIETRSLTKRYGEITALADCTLSIPRGEVFGLLGPNGAGKTTLLRLLLGFIQPSAGEARIGGLDCFRQSVAVHVQVSYLPGEARLFRQMRGREALAFFCRMRAGDLQQGLRVTERLGLDTTRQVAKMSTGMRQMLALAVALAADTPLLILDEPTSNLDPTVRTEVLAMVAEAKAAGRTIVFSSHVLSEVEQCCDRVTILRGGQVVHDQVISQLRRQHRIHAKTNGNWLPPPKSFEGQLRIERSDDGELMIETPGELSPLLSWLAELHLSEVHIEPVGLQAIYERYHGPR